MELYDFAFAEKLEKMIASYRGRDFLSMNDLTGEEIEEVLDLASELKIRQKKGIPTPILKGKTLAMIFSKNSTRTRVSFEVGMVQLGGYPLFITAGDSQLSRGEPIADTARVLSRMVDGIMIRTYSHSEVEELAHYADVPVINGLTDYEHPCQIMADLMTIKEHKGQLKGLKVAWVGDGNNVCHSLMIGAAKVGMEVAVATPPGYEPDEKVSLIAQKETSRWGTKLLLTHDPVAAVTGADVVVTDVWASMGQEAESAERVKVFQPYQVNGELVSYAKEDFIFLHCLPAHRGEEVTSEVIDGEHSVVFDEAENRLHAQKAILTLLLG
ncbi:ornithine carbamoyltransferase [Carboxydothermus islandicus]|uniref:Ornithine carbamoyltransferase n=1 Tax=Carboxydothermus islandicus TaxID=661089 RepID=A0A1L8D0A0_9THEO|nr:ornithine carbamoyltransferase [Carboxydothermus islandicus]